MGVIVQFDYAKWVARYPEFAGVSQPTAQVYFDEGTIYFANDGRGPVTDATQQLTLLNMVTAHIAYLNAPEAQGGSGSPLVGRITTASEGSVSVGVDTNGPVGSAWWFMQSKYGANFWQATMPFRQMRYRAGFGRNFNPMAATPVRGNGWNGGGWNG